MIGSGDPDGADALVGENSPQVVGGFGRVLSGIDDELPRRLEAPGVDVAHPMFASSLTAQDTWYDFADGDALPMDDGTFGQDASGHGTEVAGLALIVAPGAKGNGSPSPRTVEFVDLYPTLADLAGLAPPQNLAGASLKPLLENPSAAWTKPAFTQVWRGGFPGHSVRTERYRYTDWDGGKQGVQLYDYQADPNEWHNLAGRDDQRAGPAKGDIDLGVDSNLGLQGDASLSLEIKQKQMRAFSRHEACTCCSDSLGGPSDQNHFVFQSE